MNIAWDYNGKWRHYEMPGAYQIQGVKRRGVTEDGKEYFETCPHDSPDCVGWTVSYDGIVWCGVTFSSPKEVQAVVETMAQMFHAGVRHNQLQVKKVLGIS